MIWILFIASNSGHFIKIINASEFTSKVACEVAAKKANEYSLVKAECLEVKL